MSFLLLLHSVYCVCEVWSLICCCCFVVLTVIFSSGASFCVAVSLCLWLFLCLELHFVPFPIMFLVMFRSGT